MYSAKCRFGPSGRRSSEEPEGGTGDRSVTCDRSSTRHVIRLLPIDFPRQRIGQETRFSGPNSRVALICAFTFPPCSILFAPPPSSRLPLRLGSFRRQPSTTTQCPVFREPSRRSVPIALSARMLTTAITVGNLRRRCKGYDLIHRSVLRRGQFLDFLHQQFGNLGLLGRHDHSRSQTKHRDGNGTPKSERWYP